MGSIDLAVGKRIGNYFVEELIGRGTFGRVYRAKHAYLEERVVAIKILRSDYTQTEKERNAFLREAKFLGKLKHPHILPIIDVGQQDDLLYMIVEYAPRGSLLQRIETATKLSERIPMAESMRILSQVGQALHFAHLHEIVHCDLKPANILFNEKGDAVLADFGIAVQLQGGATARADDVRGTPQYMAPEQFQENIGLQDNLYAKASVKSDQYSLACIAYQLFTGRTPFKVEPKNDRWSYVMEWANRHTHSIPEPLKKYNPDVSTETEDAILKALAKDRRKRHDNVSSFIMAMTTQTSLIDVADMPTLLVDEPLQIALMPEQAVRTVEVVLVEAESYRKMGQLQEALATYNEAIQMDGKNAEIYFRKGNVLYELKAVEQSLLAYEQAIELMPEKDIFYIRKGNVLNELRYYEGALEAYTRAAELAPAKAFVHVKKGDTLRQLKRYNEALDAYNDALRCFPAKDIAAKAYAGKGDALASLRSRDPKYCLESAVAYRKAVELEPDNAALYLAKGNAHWKCRQNDEACKAYTDGLRIDPQNKDLLEKKNLMCK